jgi:hypothetical protein
MWLASLVTNMTRIKIRMRRLKKNQNRGIKKIEIKLKGKRGIEKKWK